MSYILSDFSKEIAIKLKKGFFFYSVISITTLYFNMIILPRKTTTLL